jgi:hypothetical protein
LKTLWITPPDFFYRDYLVFDRNFVNFVAVRVFFNFFKALEEFLIIFLVNNGQMGPQHVSSFAHLVNSKTLVAHFYITA